jgi:hypothetical protein
VTSEVPEAVWKRHQIGDTIRIRYMPDDPHRSRMDEHQRSAMGKPTLILVVIGGLLVVTGTGLVLTAILRACRRAYVVRHGIPTLGFVTEVVATPARRLGYTFLDHRGVRHDGQTADLAGRRAEHWHMGDPILVLYHPDNLLRHEVDLFGARADDLAQLANGTQGK